MMEKNFMKKLVVLASVAALAMISGACAQDSASSLTGPSSVAGASVIDSSTGVRTAEGKPTSGGGGGKKGGGGTSTTGSGSLTLVMLSDLNGDGSPNWGDTVTFTVVAPGVAEPTVQLLCSQNGVGVLGAAAGFYDSYAWPWTRNMTLSSTAWASGAASCTATLYPLGASSTVLAKITFTAGA
jgi:hypothetical protein